MKEKIVKILEEITEETIEDTSCDLVAADILDSFDIVELVVELEEAFDIVIDVDLVTSENFRTVDAIVNMMESLLEA